MNLKLKYYLLLLAFTCTVNQVMAASCLLSGYSSLGDALCNGPVVTPDGACVAGTNVGLAANIGGTGCLECTANGVYHHDFMRFTATSTLADITLNSTGIQNADVALITNSPGGCGDATSSCPAAGSLCLYACVTSVGTGSVTLSYTSLTIGGFYIIEIESDKNDEGTFNICIVTPLPAPPANAYGIYAEDGSSTTTDCEIYAVGGTGGGTACKVCTPTPDAFTSTPLSQLKLITADNISCINTNLTVSTASASPDWTGSDAPLTGAGSPKTVQYTTNGRKNVVLLPTTPVTISIYGPEDFEGAASGWTGQETSAPTVASNYWFMRVITPGTVKAGWFTLGADGCTATNRVLNGLYSPGVSYSNGSGGYSCDFLNIATANRRLYTPAFSTSGYTGTFVLTFNYRGDMDADATVQLQYSTDGSVWTNIAGELYNTAVTSTTLRTVTLPAGVANQATVYIGWNFNSTGGAVNSPPTFLIDDITVVENHNASNLYSGFINMQQTVPSTGSVLGLTSVCPNIASNYSSSVAGTPGFTYSWTATTGCGTCGSTLTTPLLSSTDITFTNPTGVNQTFTVSLTITSQCCGALTPVTKVVTVYPQPANPAATATPASICTGGTSILSVTGPIAGFNYGWYTVPTGGTAFATGTSAIINPVLLGATTYYIDAVSNNGCPAAARGSVVVTGTNTPPVVPDPPSKCAPGIITATVSSPVPGATYNWYSDPGLTTLLQSSTATSYGINVPGPAPNDVTVYVTVIEPGCGASTADPTTASITASVPVAHWTGAVSTDWFTPGNWYGGCVPTCGTVVRIDNAVPPCSPGCGTVANECVINFDNGGIACASDIRIQSGRTLTLVGAKAVLEVTGNWKLCGAFTAGTGLVKFTGSAAQSIGGTVVATFYNLAIDKSASAVTMLLNANVSNQLNLTNGVLGLNSNTLTITNGDTTAILRANGSVLSENALSLIQWNTNTGGSYVFPFGYSGTYIPFTFNKKGDATARNISTGTWNTPVTDNKGVGDVYLPSGTTLDADTGTQFFIDRWWTITPVPWTDGVDSAGVTFAFTAAELATILNPGLDSAVTYHWNSGIGRWNEIVATVAGNSVTSRWLSFSGGGGGGKGGGVPLPIRLLSFDAKPNLNVVDLTWVTASETNNDYFTIEKTTNAADFDIVVKVPGAGTSTQVLYYSAVDRNPYYGTSYYRLKQTDYDGKYEYSDLVAVKFLKKLNFSVRPNPATDYLEITFGEISKNVIFVMTPEYDASIKIYDALGEIVYEKKFNGTFYKFNIDISSFSQGMYFVSLTANNELYKAKFVKE